MTVQVVQFTIAGQSEEAASGLGRPYTVVFDGTCKVCNRLAKVLRGWDHARLIEVVPSQAPGVMARFPWIPPKAFTEALQMVGPGGQTWAGAAAIEQILNVVPKGKLIAWVFKIPFVRVVADRFYKWFARNRYKMGCGAHCQSRPVETLFEA
jgi:predicted DCC family thiol-disulfide oxidoreductase YuxK